MKANDMANNRKKSTLLLPSIIAFGFIPLIMHAFYYDCKLSQFDWFPNDSDQMSDYFLAWKMVAIIIIGVVMGVILLYRHYIPKETLRFDNAFYMLMLYGLFVAMSALFSKYKHWVSFGTHQMFESVWVLFAYIIFCYYTFQYVKSETQVIALLKWSGVGILLLLTIGIFQWIGFDFFKSTIGKLLISNPSSWGNVDNIRFNVPKHTVYATLYNQNYLSFYCGILIPLLLAIFIGCKKFKIRIIIAIMEILAIGCMIGAQSSSGWLALILTFGITGVILLSRKKKYFYFACGAIVFIIVAGVIVCCTTSLGKKVSNLFIGTQEASVIKGIDTTGDNITMNINNHILCVTYELDESTNQVSVQCTNNKGENLNTTPLAEDPTTSVINDEGYLGCMVAPVMYDEQRLAVDIKLEDHNWYFTKDDAGNYCFINQAGKLERYQSGKFSTFFKEDAVSGRGHIWDGVIPILSKYIAIGSGANTFMFAYPQNDYIYREYMDTKNVLDVKAHSLYLQQWVENGMIAMIAFIAFYIWYAVCSIRIYRKANLKDSFVWIGIGIFAGTLTYMFVGLANDSNVCTAPVFWIVMGLGLAINRIIMQKENLTSSIDINTSENAEKPVTINNNTNKKKQSRKQRKNSK